MSSLRASRDSAQKTFREISAAISAASVSVSGHTAPPNGFVERDAQVNGVGLHYAIGGKGSVVVLLQGHTRTGCVWRPVMAELAQRHTVIVPDLNTRNERSSARRVSRSWNPCEFEAGV